MKRTLFMFLSIKNDIVFNYLLDNIITHFNTFLGTQNRNATSVQARANFPEGCCACVNVGPPLCKVSCCPSNYFNIEKNDQDTN